MKLMVLLLAILAGVWLIKRQQLRAAAPKRQSPRTPPRVAQAMPILACQHCGVHVPQNEAVTGRQGGVYCCAAHRRASEPSA